MAYPSNIDTTAQLPSNIQPTSPQSAPSHSGQHNYVNAAVVAIETLLGINGANFVADADLINVCRVKSSTSQTIASGVVSPVNFGAEDYDGNSMHSNVTLNSRITIAVPGIYVISGGFLWDSQVLGTVALLSHFIMKNGSIVDGTRYTVLSPAAAAFALYGLGINIGTHVRCAAGDYIELGVFHDKAAAGTLNTGNVSPNALAAAWIAP